MKGTWDSARDPLAALRRGDPVLFEAFVEGEAGTFLGFFQRHGAGRTEAEDLTQEVFLKLYRNAAQYQPQGTFEAYAMRIARNAWIDHNRRKVARPVVELPELEPRARTHEPGARLERREEWQRLRAALASLPPAQAQAFELGVIQRRPYEEIARELGIPEGTVKSRVHHAVLRLRKALTQEPT